MFADWTTASLARNLASADPDLSAGNNALPGTRAYDPMRIDKLEDQLARYEDHFSRHLHVMLERYGCLQVFFFSIDQ